MTKIIRPLIQAALNGNRLATAHPALPVTGDELVRDAVACVAAGAGAVHLHPRDTVGAETLDPAVVNDVAARVRAAAGVPVGVTTGAWIEPDLLRRVALIREWRKPDYASVNLSESGAVEVMRALIDAGVGIEAGVDSVADIETLAASGLAGSPAIVRVLLEPVSEAMPDEAAARALITALHAALDRHGIAAPRLQHTDGALAWFAVSDALRRGIATRIGLEDTLTDPDGAITAGNAALVRAAVALWDAGGRTAID